jgi:hypothetical protein
MRDWHLKLNNRMVAWAGVLGAGLLPCPDCGLPLAVKLWPIAAVVGLFQWFKRRSARRLELLLTDDVATKPRQLSDER